MKFPNGGYGRRKEADLLRLTPGVRQPAIAKALFQYMQQVQAIQCAIIYILFDFEKYSVE
jgi:hypothetical protein